MRACGSRAEQLRCLSCSIFVRIKESVIRSALSSPCWSLPHLLSSSLPQHAALLGQRDFLQEDTVHQEPLSQEPLPKATWSESNAKEPLSHLNYESGGNLRPNTPTQRRHYIRRPEKTREEGTCLTPTVVVSFVVALELSCQLVAPLSGVVAVR